jgi:hypothetical protein
MALPSSPGQSCFDPDMAFHFLSRRLLRNKQKNVHLICAMQRDEKIFMFCLSFTLQRL